MSYQVIARKWRPQSFDEVTGQEPITRTLRNAIENERLSGGETIGDVRVLASKLKGVTVPPGRAPSMINRQQACQYRVCHGTGTSRNVNFASTGARRGQCSSSFFGLASGAGGLASTT